MKQRPNSETLMDPDCLVLLVKRVNFLKQRELILESRLLQRL